MVINRLKSVASPRPASIAISVIFLTLMFSGCGPKGSGQGTASATSTQTSDGYDFGQDWDQRLVPTQPNSDVEVSEDDTYWVLVLATFTSNQHIAQAQQWLRDARTLIPELAQARVEPHRHGSMVVWGRYNGWDDQRVEPDRQKLLALEIDGRKIFPSAILKKIERQPVAGEISPFDLRSARIEFPTIVPLYTLDVAVWVDPEDPQGMDRQLRRRSAEAYAGQLRGQNIPAYFHHNEDLQMSSVTIGLFDRRALDPSTGLRSLEVDEMANRFPARLLNGAPLEAPVDVNDPTRGTYRQRPFLVEVPEF